jgi:hypothetical protein
MRRVWATVVAVWATLAIVAGLAWTRHAPPQPVAQPAPTTLVVKSKNGTQRLVVLGTAATTTPTTHATTQPSPPPVG